MSDPKRIPLPTNLLATLRQLDEQHTQLQQHAGMILQRMKDVFHGFENGLEFDPAKFRPHANVPEGWYELVPIVDASEVTEQHVEEATEPTPEAHE